MPLTPSTQSDFLDLVDRVTSPSYLEPLKVVGPGYEVYQQDAAVKARVSLAVSRLDRVAYILDAPTGSFAQCSVNLSRAAGGPAMTVKAGSIFTTSNGGRDFVLMQDVPFGNNDPGPYAATVQAVRQSYQWNVPGPVTTASGDTLPGDIDTVKNLIEDPVYSDTTVVVEQLNDATGGAPAALAQLGKDRGLVQNPSESSDQFRARVRTLPDTVSPGAIKRALARFLSPYTTWRYVETWEPEIVGCWDAPGSDLIGTFDPTNFVYDDDRQQPPFRGRWLDENFYRAAFLVIVDDFGPLADFGMAYDDPGDAPADFENPLGQRSVSAYDVPTGYTHEQIGAYDGQDYQKQAVFLGLYQLLKSIKAGGVAFSIELAGQ